jgi:hypothetical protein
MKKKRNLFAFAVLPALFIYLCISFINLNLNAGEWNEKSREAMVCLYPVFLFFCVGVYLEIELRNKKK